MKKSKYIIFIKNDNAYVCYNTISGSYIHIGKKYTDGYDFIYSNLSDNILDKLYSMHFILKENDDEREFVYDEYEKMNVKFNKTLYLTIEITSLCNFECAFCYQRSWDKRKEITYSTIQDLIRLMDYSILSNFSELNIDFIGGEPLLYSKKLLYIYDQFSQLCNDIGIKLSIKINTNGYYLNKDILENIENTEIMFPYLAPQDYGNIVNLKNNPQEKNLFNKLRRKIESWVPVLNQNKSNLLVFRFNANHQNINYITDYFNDITSLGLEKFDFTVVNTHNNKGADYINNLSENEFYNWYINIVMPLCIKYNIKFPIQPRNSISRCKARRPYSFKLFANGKVGLCNGIEYDSILPKISEINSLYDINDIFKDIKSYRYIFDDEECQNCKLIFLCGGASPCNGKNCKYELSNIDKYILMKSKL